jgi:hypothetical protein
MVRVASFNVENLFARPKAFNTTNWSVGQPALDAYREVNTLLSNTTYSAADKDRIRDLLVTLDIYSVNNQGAIRRKRTQSPRCTIAMMSASTSWMTRAVMRIPISLVGSLANSTQPIQSPRPSAMISTFWVGSFGCRSNLPRFFLSQVESRTTGQFYLGE